MNDRRNNNPNACPPHDAVLDENDKLVCDRCGVRLEIDPTCLGCIIDATGAPHFQARHVCEDQSLQMRSLSSTRGT